eukprot:8185392-Pyramimonas_sp.AAC.1
MPSLKGDLQQSWSLIRTWEKQCSPCRATPFTAQIVLALAAAASDLGWYGLTTILLVGFDAFMRTGELLALQRRHVLVKYDRATILIETSKMGLRTGFSEVVRLRDGVSRQVLRARCP